MELMCTYVWKTNELEYTPKGRECFRNNVKGEWFIEAFIEGKVHPDYKYLVEDDTARRDEVELSKLLHAEQYTPNEKTELTGEEIDMRCARDHIPKPSRIKDTLPDIKQAYQDIIAGYTAYSRLSIKLYRTDKPRRNKRKRK